MKPKSVSTKLESAIITELVGFDLIKLFKVNGENNSIELPLFHLRIKMHNKFLPDDSEWVVMEIPEMPALDKFEILFILAQQGYLHYLRAHKSSAILLHCLQNNENWKRLILRTIDLENNSKTKSPYKIQYLRDLLNVPLWVTLGHSPDAFDWLITRRGHGRD